MLACRSPGAVRCFSLRSDAVTQMPSPIFQSLPDPGQMPLCVPYLGVGGGTLGPRRSAMMDVLTHRGFTLLSPHPEVIC